ncbi:MAG: response regulator [Planctomycetota bacterium]
MSSNRRILVADDDPRVTAALSTRLENKGFEVITASDGYNSFAKAVRDRPDVMLLDINMPAGDGFSVLERMERMDEQGGIPTIYLTGDHSARLDAMATSLGALAVHHKPIDMKLLMSDIDRALRPRAA